MSRIFQIIICIIFLTTISFAQTKSELKRKVAWRFSVDYVAEGVKMRSVEAGGTMDKLGLKVGDILTNMNGISPIQNKHSYGALLSNTREGDSVVISFLRNGQQYISRDLAIGLPQKKNTDQIIWQYDWVPVDNGKMRVVVQSAVQKKLTPAILYITDFPCRALDYHIFFDNPHSRLLQQLTKAGYTIVLVEKTEFGDNENIKGCEEYDLKTETDLYKAAYRYMQNLSNIDTSNLFIWGNGVNAIIAATLANEKTPKGIISYGAHYRPWSEYWFQRLRWHSYTGNRDLLLYEAKAKEIKQVFDDFFVNKIGLDDLLKKEGNRKILENYFDYTPENGGMIMRRNWQYWRQLDAVNIPELWKNIHSYLLLLQGAVDVESFDERDQWMLADVVNTYNPNAASYLKLDSIDHNFVKTSIGVYNKVPARGNFVMSDDVGNKTIEWLKIMETKDAYKRPSIIIPKDTSLLNMNIFAHSIIANSGRSTIEKVQTIIKWANSNLTWTGTDYKTRTPKQVLCMREGNCNEEAIVAVALFKELGIKCRRVREINIQPFSEKRQKDAERLVSNLGIGYSVFGLRHNDHVWIEFFNEETKEWLPADPTLGLVGTEQWINARVGFKERPVHHILPSRDMLVPIAIFAFDDAIGNIVEDRTAYYLVQQFNAVYKNTFNKKPEWQKWVNSIHSLSLKCKAAFRGTLNLHLFNAEIEATEKAYLELKATYDQSSF